MSKTIRVRGRDLEAGMTLNDLWFVRPGKRGTIESLFPHPNGNGMRVAAFRETEFGMTVEPDVFYDIRA